MTEGYEAEPADVLAMVTPVANVRDPLERFERASSDLVLHQAVCEQLARIRAAALVEMYGRDNSYAALARITGLSRARVQQIIESGR